MTWIPQDPSKDIPVSLLKPPGYTAKKPKTRHPDAACWYHMARDAEGVERCYPLVFTKDTAGTWYDEVSELWDLTQGRITDADEVEGTCTFDILILLRKITEHIEQGVFAGDEACVQTYDSLREILEQLR